MNSGAIMSAPGSFPIQPSLSVEGLSLMRGGRTLFEALSFAVAPGDFVEIRGPNGAGKTSLLRVLAGFLPPGSGAVAFAGAPEPDLALHYLGHLDGLKLALSARAHARYWAALLGEGGDGAQALARVGLGAIADLPARALSQGQRRRLALARLIAAPRPIWMLDEPAAGLDGAGKAMLAGLIAEHRAAGGLALAALHEPLALAASAVIALGPA
jgi:heme exporter protein A